MPATVNGVGTHYYGKRNRTTRQGVCHSCGAQAVLESYDTGLYFVVLFIPIIPLGRKRIIDECSRCSRHYVADQAKYERTKQLDVSAALQKYQADPSPDTAMELHARLLSFQMFDEADKIRASVLEEHPQHAELRVVLAAHLDQTGRSDEAAPLLEQALQLQPDLPEARVGVAHLRMSQGNLEEARRLLDFLDQPGAGQKFSLEPLEILAHAYQAAGQHAETLALCKRLISELPNLGEIYDFRKFVARSERALPGHQPLLPARPFSLLGLFSARGPFSPGMRRLAWITAIVLLVLICLAGYNEFLRQRRTVIAMNDCGQPAQLSIDGGAAVTFQGTTRLTLAEGKHHVKVAGPIDEEFDIEMSTGYFQRWTSRPAWVIMAGGGTALAEEEIIYAQNPVPPKWKLIIGKRFHYVPHVDYCFENPPQSINLSKKTRSATKIHLGVAREKAVDLVQYAAAAGTVPEALAFAQTRLQGTPGDSQLLDAYAETLEKAGKIEQALAFLRAGLDRRPICVPWHRVYQDLGKTTEREKTLADEYQALLRQSPDDPVLLYLYGRVATDRAESRRCFRRSADLDPKLSWPRLALAFDAASCGDWRTCRAMGEQALALDNDTSQLARLLWTSRMALRDFTRMEQECRQALATGAPAEHLTDVLKLCEVLVTDNRSNDARAAFDAWRRRVPVDQAGVVRIAEPIFHYMLGELDAIPVNPTITNITPIEFQFYALLALGRMDEMVRDGAWQQSLQEPWNMASTSLAYSIAGRKAEASAWREKAADALARRDADGGRAAAVLRSDKPPAREQLDSIALGPNMKSVLMAMLASRFPEERAQYAEMARQLNVGRMPPYHLVRQAIEKSK